MMELDESELQSVLWKKIERHCKEQLDGARQANDHDQPEFSTQRIRGQIETYKEILRLNPEYTD